MMAMPHAAPGPKERKLKGQPQDHRMEGHFWCQPIALTVAFLSQETMFLMYGVGTAMCT